MKTQEAEQEAKQLVKKYMDFDLEPWNELNKRMGKHVAKQLAILEVTNILSVLNSEKVIEPIKHWLEVKRQINQL